jgi:hypothetical protein
MEYGVAGKMGLKEEQFINDFFRFFYPTLHSSMKVEKPNKG